MLKQTSFYFYLFLIAFSIFLVISSLQIKIPDGSFLSSPMIVPVCLSFIMLIASLFIFIKEIKMNKQYHVMPEKPILFIGFFVIVLAYIYSMTIIGFEISTFLFLGVSILYLRGTSLIKTILIALGIVIIIVLLFGTLFQVVFPTGRFGNPLYFLP